MLSGINSTDKHILDILSVGTLGGVYADVVPAVVLTLTGAYTLIRIWETDTVQKIFGRKKNE